MSSERTQHIEDQYRDSSKLQARARIYQYSTNTQPWFDWVSERIVIEPGDRVLELGCGKGWLWTKLAARLPNDVAVLISDISPGMLLEASRGLSQYGFAYECIDACNIPHGDQIFDTVIANHILFHVPDLPRALSEIRRVLRPGGRLYSTTYGETHLAGLKEWIREYDHRLVVGDLIATGFSFESCPGQLREFFSAVEVHVYENELRVPHGDAIVDYARSVLSGESLAFLESRMDDFRAYLEQKRRATGFFHLYPSSGMVVSRL